MGRHITQEAMESPTASNGQSGRLRIAKLSVPRWFTPAIATDWVVSVLMLAFDRVYLTKEPFQQPLKPFIGDPTLQYKHVADQTVPGELNTILTLMVPLAIVLLISAVRRSLKEAHHAALGLYAGYQLNNLATNFIKLKVGRFRPDFFDRCQYDAVKEVCTGPYALVQEGRRSFPSGHSSSAFFGCVFLMLFLAGKNRCFAYASTFPHSGILHSKFLRLFIGISPLFASTFIAVSRYADHWHHPTDIIAGSCLGTLIAVATYLIWWPSPFSSENYETMDTPRKTHLDLEEEEQLRLQDDDDYESEGLVGSGEERV